MDVNIPGLIGLGFIVGTLSGLFGVGGGFLITPMLNAVFGIPYNFAVGSGLCQMIGTSGAASLRHGVYSQVDYKLASLLLVGSLPGVEIGAQILDALEGMGTVSIGGQSFDVLYISLTIIYIFLLLPVGVFMFKEGKTARGEDEQNPETPDNGTFLSVVPQKLRALDIPPRVSCPISEIKSICVWIPIFFGFLVGLLSGLLGVGGGFILVPILIYLMGVSTRVVVGTSLFQMIFTAGYGTLTHLFKGNIDFLLVVLILAGSLVGSQLGVILNKKMKTASLRYYFSWVIFGAIAIILIKFSLI